MILEFALSFALQALPASAADDCDAMIARAEKTSDSNCKAAEPLAKAAVRCGTARPFMVLAVCANRAGRFNDVITWSEKALEREPGLALAYMDECSAYSQLKKYDRAVEVCKKGLAQPNEWSAMINFNIGLALFQKAVDARKFNDALQSEPYFLASKKIDPKIAQNDYYLGTITENVKMKPSESVVYFKSSCDLGYKTACESLARAKKESLAVAAAPAPVLPPATGDEGKLWAALEKMYRKKGLSAEIAQKTASTIRTNMASLPPAQRLEALQSMIKSMNQ